MLQNAYLLAKIGADTAENKQRLPKFAKNWQLVALCPARRELAALATSRAELAEGRLQQARLWLGEIIFKLLFGNDSLLRLRLDASF